MKVILPVAGKGERMRPYTNNTPKCLLPVGGKTILDWIVADTLPLKASETIFITGYLAHKVDEFLITRPNWGKTRTILQADPQGLGQAISLALPHVPDNEPLLIILGDTLFDADLSILAPCHPEHTSSCHPERSASEVEGSSNILFTYKVEDPSRFGVAVTTPDGSISKLEEKPQEFVSDEAIVGIYYIKDVKELKASLQYLMENNIRTKGEFQLTDALQMMIEKGCKFRTAPVKEWLDCDLPETLIETNTWLLQNKDGLNNVNRVAVDQRESIRNVKLIPPCIIGKNAIIENCTIGPNVSIGNNCTIKNAQLKNCVVWDYKSLTEDSINKKIIA